MRQLVEFVQLDGQLEVLNKTVGRSGDVNMDLNPGILVPITP